MQDGIRGDVVHKEHRVLFVVSQRSIRLKVGEIAKAHHLSPEFYNICKLSA
jgi:hypothetical protein